MRKKWLALALSMAMVVGSITGCCFEKTGQCKCR